MNFHRVVKSTGKIFAGLLCLSLLALSACSPCCVKGDKTASRRAPGLAGPIGVRGKAAEASQSWHFVEERTTDGY